MITILKMGIGFYQESTYQDRAEIWDNFHAVSLFYRLQLLDEVSGEFWNDET